MPQKPACVHCVESAAMDPEFVEIDATDGPRNWAPWNLSPPRDATN
ncbi:unnamed protein product, partial [Allacma fusca]